MPFAMLFISIFIMFLQPSAILNSLSAISILRNSILVSLITYVLSNKYIKEAFVSNKANVYLIYFIFFQVVSSLFVWSMAALLTFEQWLMYLITYFLIDRLAYSCERIQIICMSIIAGISYLTYYSITSFVINYEPGMRAGGFGWYQNSNDLAIILVCVIPLCFLIYNNYNSFFRYILLVLACAMSFNILFTGSRNGLLGLLAVAGSSLILSSKLSKLIKAIAAVILVISVTGVGVKNVISRNDLSGLSGDTSSENRLVQWKAGINMLISHPLFGVGPDRFEELSAEYGGEPGLAPHNTIIQVFSETGLIGGYCFLMFVIFPIVEGIKIVRSHKNRNSQIELNCVKFLLSSIFGFWVCAIFSNRDKSYILFVLIALLVSSNRSYKLKEIR